MNRRDPDRDTDHDRGSTLAMILVLITIAGLLIVPTMTYTVTVMRANRLLVNRTASAEAAKAGLRIALADPRALYEQCANPTPNTLAIPQLEVASSTTCQLVDEVTRYESSELPWDIATTWYGTSVPAGAAVIGQAFGVPTGGDETGWWPYTTTERIAAPTSTGFETQRSIWLPLLPEHATNLRPSSGYAMPADQVNPGVTACTVYFPGTYNQAVTVNGPSYFTSGVYYFTQSLTVAPGSSVVFGSGQHAGCTDDQRAAFSAIDAPGTHNITGVGATIVFGGAGRLVVADGTTGSTSLRMNLRYVAADDVGMAPSAEVSIMTVNGMIAPDGTLDDLRVPGALGVPAAAVGGASVHPATDDGYQPSVVLPVPGFPAPPSGVTATPHQGALTVEWQAPTAAASVQVVGYRVTAVDPATTGETTCETPAHRPACTLTGLVDGTPYDVSVVTLSTESESGPSATVVGIPDAGAGPTTPASASLDATATAYDDALRLPYSPSPSNAGDDPATGYTVTVDAVSDGTTTVFAGGSCTSDGSNNECAIPLSSTEADALAAAGTITAAITAHNTAGDSTPAPTDVAVTRSTQAYQAPAPPAFTGPDADMAVIDITAAGSQPVTVDIPGYVSVPQGRVAVTVADAAAGSVRLDGGLLAAWVDLACDTGCAVGQSNEPTQRVVRIVTEAAAGGAATRSDAVVQINSNGAWMVNSWEVRTP